MTILKCFGISTVQFILLICTVPLIVYFFSKLILSKLEGIVVTRVDHIRNLRLSIRSLVVDYHLLGQIVGVPLLHFTPIIISRRYSPKLFSLVILVC